MDPRTPVVVGVGQSIDRLHEAGYRAWSPLELAVSAARAAVADCAAPPAGILAAIDAVAAVRTFDMSIPVAPGRSGGSVPNYPRAIARGLGCDPRLAVLEVAGGQCPQHLVTEFAGRIAAGNCTAALLVGAEALSTSYHRRDHGGAAQLSYPPGGQLEDRGDQTGYYLDEYAIAHEMYTAPAAYALLDNARRARRGLGVDEYRAEIGRLFAPFSRVAAANPLSAVRTARTPEQLSTPTDRNPIIWAPYPKSVIAREKVNLGAAILLMSAGAADAAGVPEANRVFLRGHADLQDLPLLERPDLASGPASVRAVTEALRVAGRDLDQTSTFDLYSCFPAPVFNICDGLGLAADDPRRLTVTGGLPFFGGPGNNYSMHAIAETVSAMRLRPGEFGLVGANGGIMSKYSVGVYSAEPAEWVPDRSAELQAEIESAPRVGVSVRAEGPAAIESYTVRCRPGTAPRGILIARLCADDSRCYALVDDDEKLLSLLSTGEPLGHAVRVESTARGNRARLG
ncbi:acetyl-CoA acetyltransferase [Nocardia sp. NPDC001965]